LPPQGIPYGNDIAILQLGELHIQDLDHALAASPERLRSTLA